MNRLGTDATNMVVSAGLSRDDCPDSPPLTMPVTLLSCEVGLKNQDAVLEVAVRSVPGRYLECVKLGGNLKLANGEITCGNVTEAGVGNLDGCDLSRVPRVTPTYDAEWLSREDVQLIAVRKLEWTARFVAPTGGAEFPDELPFRRDDDMFIE